MTTIELPNAIWLRKNLSDVLGIERGQMFRWHGPNGIEHIWSIDMALRIIGDREPNLRLRPYQVHEALLANNMAHELNVAYAVTTDLSKPLIAAPSPNPDDPEGACIIIDGWHRILHAKLRMHPDDLLIHMLSQEESESCLRERIV